MNKFWLAVLLIALPLYSQQKPGSKTTVIRRVHRAAPAPLSQSSGPIVLFNNQDATAAATSPIQPNTLGGSFGTLTISAAGIAGTSSCTLSLFYAQLSSGAVASTPFATVAGFVLSNGFQTFSITPQGGAGNASDGMVANYSCTTYPTSGTFTASFNTSLPATIVLPSTNGITPLIACNQRVIINAATVGNTQLVPAATGYSVYICGWTIMTSSNTGVNAKLVTGTGAACATTQTDVTETVVLQALTNASPTGAVIAAPSNAVDKLPLGQALCLNLSAAVQVYGKVWYAQF